MTLEENLFSIDYHYRSALINRCILIIQTSDDVRRVQAFKTFVFKAMKDIVRKNITNYINLLNSINYSDIPERDELVTECYIIFDKCVSNYNLSYYENGGNFYFFLNKSLSRCFYKDYRRAYTHNNTELTDTIQNVSNSLRVESSGSVGTLVDLLGFSDKEKRIIDSRLVGQRTSDFLDANPDITETEYSRYLKSIKNLLRDAYENDDIDQHYNIKELKKIKKIAQ